MSFLWRIVRFPLTFTIDLLDWGLATIQKLKNPLKNNTFLKGVYAPVDKEITARELKVEGVLPAELNGEFVRNGPNPKYIPRGQYHWFDGDGMLHGVRILDGQASYVNRWIKTRRLAIEDKSKKAVFLKLGDFTGKIGLLRILLAQLKAKLKLNNYEDIELDTGTANTALIFHDRKLLALVESSYPYHVKLLLDGMIETEGVYSYNKKLNHPFTAHPKVDEKTGEMMFFGYHRLHPFLTYSLVNPKGELVRSVPITLSESVMIHDMAITEHYSVFMDLPLVFRPKEMVKSGQAYVFDKLKKARIGIIPRHATDEKEMKWFTISTCFSFHTVNAWEQGEDEIILLACRMELFDLGFINEKDERYQSFLYEWKLNLKTGGVVERKLCDNTMVEFPRIHPQLLGRPTRYTYLAVFRPEKEISPIEGVMKFDLATNKVISKLMWGPGRTGGECVFVPRDKAESEDDGYLLTYVFDEKTQKSEFVVVDAKTMSSDLVAKVVLPQRVPAGFHGIFVSEKELRSQVLKA